MNKNRIVLINPCFTNMYETTRMHREGVLCSPSLTLSVLAASLIKNGCDTKVLDMNLLKDFTDRDLVDFLRTNSPGYIGITFTTPLFNEVLRLCSIIKKVNSDVNLIGGGPHASSLPEETLKNSALDIIVQGEGDFILPRIVLGEDVQNIPGIIYRKEGKIFKNPRPDFITNLDSLPFPAWELFEIEKIKITNLLSQSNPVGSIETSRGCPYGCIYCNKSVFGQTFRAKTPERVVAEIEHMLSLGFKEIHIIDDGFSTNIERSEEICRLIIQKGLHFPWSPIGGLRVDRAPKHLLELMHKAGCYRVYYGIESGNQHILDIVSKGISLAQARQAVRDAKDVGLEAYGFFIIGLPGEDEKSLEETIRFAKELDLDMAKATIATPLPGTVLFKKLEEDGFIISKDWSALNLYSPAKKLFNHPTLSWPVIEKYFLKFYRSFYLSPKFILKRFIYSLKKKRLLSDISYFLKTRW